MKRFAGLLLAVLIVAALWSAGWFYAQSQVEAEMVRLANAAGTVDDPRVTCGSSTVAGFPFRIDIGCEDATIVSDDVTVTAAGLRGSVQVDNPTHVLFSAKAPVTTSDAFYGTSTRLDFAGLQGSARLTTDNIIAGLSGEGWRVARISLVGDQLDWVDTIGADLPLAKAAHAEIQIGDIPELHDKAAGTAALAVYVVANNVNSALYDITDGNGEVQLQITGLPDDIRRFGDADAIAAWRNAGGKIEVARINGTDGDNMLDATGTLGLDANRMLTGELTYSNRGVRERLASFVNPLILSVLAGLPQEDGTFKQALQFANGNLLVGGIPLLQLAPLF